MKISHSAKDTYLTCGYKYFLNYYRKLRPIAKRSALEYGDAIDQGLNTLLETRNLEAALHVFTVKWKQKTDVTFTKSDLDEWLVPEDPTNTHLSLLRKGEILLKEYNDQIMPRIKDVIKVQIDRTVKNEEGDELVIKTDFICVWEDDRRILFDNKTSSIKYEEDSVRTSPQLSIYFEQLKDEFKLDAAGYIVIPKRVNKKKEPRVDIKVIIDVIPEETVEATLESYDQVLSGIKNGQFQKNHNSCMGKYGACEYLAYCKHGDKTGLKE